MDGLVERGMMTREEHPTDRRSARLAVTSDGRATLETLRSETLTYLAKKLNNVTFGNREVFAKEMEIRLWASQVTLEAEILLYEEKAGRMI